MNQVKVAGGFASVPLAPLFVDEASEISDTTISTVCEEKEYRVLEAMVAADDFYLTLHLNQDRARARKLHQSQLPA